VGTSREVQLDIEKKLAEKMSLREWIYLWTHSSKTLQETYLSMYTTKDDVKDYKQLIDVLNRLVGDETGFTKTRGFF
jgi:CRISPR/Cas system CSM-associated protein Csm3 (group 7 of RAMP superfamily)